MARKGYDPNEQERLCLHCGQTLDDSMHVNQRYCSYRCGKAALRERRATPERKAKRAALAEAKQSGTSTGPYSVHCLCGRDFRAKTRAARYCSDRCRRKAYRQAVQESIRRDKER